MLDANGCHESEVFAEEHAEARSACATYRGARELRITAEAHVDALAEVRRFVSTDNVAQIAAVRRARDECAVLEVGEEGRRPMRLRVRE